MIDITHCDPSIKHIIRSICERIIMLNRQQILHTFTEGMPDEAINVESDKLKSVLKMYSQLGLLDIDTIKPGRWSQWI